jgi:hypothetical protein
MAEVGGSVHLGCFTTKKDYSESELLMIPILNNSSTHKIYNHSISLMSVVVIVLSQQLAVYRPVLLV